MGKLKVPNLQGKRTIREFASKSLISFVSFIGMWMMKKWGVFTYTFVFALVQIVLLSKGLWDGRSIIIPVIIIVNGFNNPSKMT
ncbi:MAG: hypothetical protein PUP90_20340 [Nostoc sp. S4]|nr:hypothetical protein [Nostoc sp. S4]